MKIKKELSDKALENIGRVSIDLGKMLFGGVLIGAVMRADRISQLGLISIASLLFLFLITFGLFLTSKKKKDE